MILNIEFSTHRKVMDNPSWGLTKLIPFPDKYYIRALRTMNFFKSALDEPIVMNFFYWLSGQLRNLENSRFTTLLHVPTPWVKDFFRANTHLVR